MIRGELEAEAGGTTEMHKRFQKASELCKQFDDQESAEIIQEYGRRIGFEKSGEALGFLNSEQVIQEDAVEFGVKLAKKNKLDNLDVRMKGYQLREQLLNYIYKQQGVLGLGPNEAKKLFVDLGFDDIDDIRVDLDALKVYLKSMKPSTANHEPKEFIKALVLRQKFMTQLEVMADEVESPKADKLARIAAAREGYVAQGLMNWPMTTLFIWQYRSGQLPWPHSTRKKPQRRRRAWPFGCW
jgi:hypothetical protein